MAYADIPVVDAWMQHPTKEFLNREMFAPLLRWQGAESAPEIPTEWTVQAFENSGVDRALVSAWWGPDGPMLSNDYVADIVEKQPDLFAGWDPSPLTVHAKPSRRSIAA